MDFKFNISEETDNKLKELDESFLYDVLIIGGGPAGLTAAVYCMRKGVSAGLLTYNVGGQVIETAAIENYMGYRYIEGYQLVDKFRTQIRQFELGFLEGYKVKSIALEGKIKKIRVENGKIYSGKSVIIASGKSSRRLNVPGEDAFVGKGVHYCAICDAPFYKGKDVIVVGGGNSGVEAAIDLSKIAKNITIVQYNDKLTSDRILIEKLKEISNVRCIFNSQISEIKGGSSVTSCVLTERIKKDKYEMKIDGIFVEIGLIPNTDFVRGFAELNEFNEIRIDSMCRTNIGGIFAAGDATSINYKQIIVAAGEGCKASLSASEYVLKEFE